MTLDQIREHARMANPVPDPEALSPIDVLPLLDLERSEAMTATETVRPDPRRSARGRRPFMVLAMAVSAAVVGIVLFGLIGQEPDEPATPTSPATQAVYEWAAALDAGDPSAAVDTLDPSWADGRVRSIIDFLAGQGAGYTMADCSETPIDDAVNVTCTMTVDDPIMNELGLSELPFEAVYRDQGLEVVDLGDRLHGLSTFSLYAESYEEERFDEVCNANLVEGTSWPGSRHVMTADCAALWKDITDDAASWIRDGKPLP